MGDAEKLHREILSIDRKIRGETDRQTIASRLNLAGVVQAQGRYDEAEEMIRASVDQLRTTLGEDATIEARYQLVGNLEARGEFAEAESLAREVFLDYARIAGEESESAGTARRQLAGILLARGNEEEARHLYGARLPGEWGAREWIQANAGALDDSVPTLIVFWEPWCPFSTREMPKLEKWYRSFRDDGLRVVGLTELSRGSTKERALAFIDEADVSFPIAEVNDELRSYIGRGSVPFAVVAKNATVLWTGHPAQLFPAALEGVLSTH